MSNIEYVLRECPKCNLVNANGYMLCPVCGNKTEHYKTLYGD